MPKGPCAARVLLILLSQLFSLKDGPAPPPAGGETKMVLIGAMRFHFEEKKKRKRRF